MAGDGPEFDSLKDTISKYGLQNRILLVGMIENVEELLNDTFLLLVVSKRRFSSSCFGSYEHGRSSNQHQRRGNKRSHRR